MATHANADIQISGGGSGVGIQAIGAKTVDIGMSSREVTADEKAKYPAFVITPVAQDGIAVIVNPANEIQYITLDQIKNIYLGKITKWTEITGANVPGTNNQIVVIGRDSASGTRSYFDEVAPCKGDPDKTDAREELQRCRPPDRCPDPRFDRVRLHRVCQQRREGTADLVQCRQDRCTRPRHREGQELPGLP